jgi:hypothetical protein
MFWARLVDNTHRTETRGDSMRKNWTKPNDTFKVNLPGAGSVDAMPLLRNFSLLSAEDRILRCIIELGEVDLGRPVLSIPGYGPFESCAA